MSSEVSTSFHGKLLMDLIIAPCFQDCCVSLASAKMTYLESLCVKRCTLRTLEAFETVEEAQFFLQFRRLGSIEDLFNRY